MGSAPTGKTLMGMSNNFGFVSYPWMNILKGVIFASAGGSQSFLNAQQYLTSDPGVNVPLGELTVPGDLTTIWNLKWSGPIAFNPQGGGVLTILTGIGFVTGANNNLFHGTDGQVRFRFTDLTIDTAGGHVAPTMSLIFPTGFTYGGGNLTMVRDTDRAAFDAAVLANDLAGQMMPEHIAEALELNANTRRTVGWADVNDLCNFSHFAYRAPTNSFSYADRWEPKALVGTIAGTNSYTCGPSTDMPTTLQPLIPFQGKVTNANTNAPQACTFNATATIAAPGSNFTAGQLVAFLDNFNGGIPVGESVISPSLLYWVLASGLTANAFQVSTTPGGTAVVPSTSGAAKVLTHPTISYNGGAAIPLVYIFPNNQQNAPQRQGVTITANAACTFVYDATLGVVMVSVGGGITSGVPIEEIIALCNKTRANLWRNLPHLYSDASVAAETAVTKSTLTPNLIWRPGLSNEVWNNGFSQTIYAELMTIALGITPPAGIHLWHPWYSLRAAQVFTLIRSLWPGAAAGLEPVAEFQATGDAGDVAELKAYRLEGATLPEPHNTYPNRLVDLASILSFAHYVSGAQTVPEEISFNVYAAYIGDLVNAANTFAAGGAGIATGLNWLDNDIRQGTINYPVANTLGGSTLKFYHDSVYPKAEALAAGYDSGRAVPLKASCYEGMLSINWPTTAVLTAGGYANPATASANCKALIIAYRNDPRAKQVLLDIFSQFRDAVNFPHFDMPACLIIEAPFTEDSTLNFGYWALRKGDLFSAKWATYDAVVQFNFYAPLFAGRAGVCVDF